VADTAFAAFEENWTAALVESEASGKPPRLLKVRDPPRINLISRWCTSETFSPDYVHLSLARPPYEVYSSLALCLDCNLELTTALGGLPSSPIFLPFLLPSSLKCRNDNKYTLMHQPSPLEGYSNYTSRTYHCQVLWKTFGRDIIKAGVFKLAWSVFVILVRAWDWRWFVVNSSSSWWFLICFIECVGALAYISKPHQWDV
jgi:hypothetical protein